MFLKHAQTKLSRAYTVTTFIGSPATYMYSIPHLSW